MMEKQYRLRKNYQFNYVYKNGKAFSNKYLVVIFCQNKNNVPKIGFSISKKFGKAVRRNKMRRRLKEIINKRFSLLCTKYNYVFLPRIVDEPATFKQLEKSVDYLLGKIEKQV